MPPRPPHNGKRGTVKGRRLKYCCENCANLARADYKLRWQQDEENRAKKQAMSKKTRAARAAYNRSWYLKNLPAIQSPGGRARKARYMRGYRQGIREA